jgi:hypothetical protein
VTFRLGLHLNALTPRSRRQALAGYWRVIKTLGGFDPAFLAEVRAANPGVILVGRAYTDQGSFDADAMVNLILTQPGAHLYDYWESYNEALNSENAQQLADFNVAVAKRLHAAGLKHCALSLASGTPGGTDAEITKTLGILWPAVAASDAWSYHAYGAPLALSDEDWYAVRYRKYLALDPRYATRPLILSEGGADYGVLKGQHGGYRAHGVSDADYAKELLAANTEFAKDATVLGMTIYQAGDDTDPLAWTDCSTTWGSFCATDALIAALAPSQPEVRIMPDYTAAHWVSSPNFGFPNVGDHGREGHAIAGIVLHGTAGGNPVTNGWFTSTASGVSAHYVVDTDGTVFQCVLEDDAAYHAGVVTPNSVYAAGINPNLFTIGIEHVRDRTNSSAIAPAQLVASVALIHDIMRRRGPLKLITHDEIDVGRVCPGPDFPLQQIIAAVTPAPQPAPDPDLSYFGQLGHTPSAESALYKFALSPLRQLYQALAAGDLTRVAALLKQYPSLPDLVNPGPCVGGEYTVVEGGVTKNRIPLSNRVLETQNHAGVWVAYQAEVLKA